MGLFASRRDKKAFKKKVQECLEQLQDDQDCGGARVCMLAEGGNKAALEALAPMYKALHSTMAIPGFKKDEIHQLLKHGRFVSAMEVARKYNVYLRRYLPRESN